MKNLRGLIVTAVICLLTVLLYQTAARFDVLMDMAYPFFSKTIMEVLGGFTGKLDFCLWQVALAVYAVAILVSLALVILFRGNLLRWLGGILVPVALAGFLQCGIWGLNYHNKPVAESMKLEVKSSTPYEVYQAASYYRNQADALAKQVSRTADGDVILPAMEKMNKQVAGSYDELVWKYSVFAGPRTPVKELGWSELFTSLGVESITIGLTGEAAVNMDQYGASIPFAMCRETACLMSFARQEESNFAAYLACEHSTDTLFRYSGYLNAFLYCSNALYDTNKVYWNRLWEDVSPELRHDVEAMNLYASAGRQDATEKIDEAYGLYLEKIGEKEGRVADLLVAWYDDQYRPVEVVPENPFDPTDYDWVFPSETEPDATEATEGT